MSVPRAEHIAALNRHASYMRGWRLGSRHSAIPKELAENADFQRGYGDGLTAHGKASALEREALGLPPASFIRTLGDELYQDPGS